MTSAGVKSMLQLVAVPLLIAAAAVSSAPAADISKEGRYDFISCWSGVSTEIVFSKTHSARTYEITGATRSNPPGGFADKTTFRCIGMNHSFDGKAGATSVCEMIDPDGDKRLAHFSTLGGNVVREHVAGTGKYDGMTMTGNVVQPLGPFPVIKPGTFQDCNEQTGTYKLK